MKVIGDNWDTIKSGAAAAIKWIKDRVEDLIGMITSIPEKVGSVLSKIPGAGLVKGGAGLIGKLNPFHTGGIVPGPRGTEVPIMAMAGEQVGWPGQMGGGGTTVIQLQIDKKTVTELVHNGMLEKQRRTGSLGLS